MPLHEPDKRTEAEKRRGTEKDSTDPKLVFSVAMSPVRDKDSPLRKKERLPVNHEMKKTHKTS